MGVVESWFSQVWGTPEQSPSPALVCQFPSCQPSSSFMNTAPRTGETFVTPGVMSWMAHSSPITATGWTLPCLWCIAVREILIR